MMLIEEWGGPLFTLCSGKMQGGVMAKKKAGVAESVRALAEPVVQSMGLELWDVLFVKEGPSWVLRIIIDSPGGVFIDDCERVSRAVEPLIDELDPVEREYCLEVSSPGMGRALRTDGHLKAFEGRDVKLRLYSAAEGGGRGFCGRLAGFDASGITLEIGGEARVFARGDIAGIYADDDPGLFKTR
jgi:ribosome maturation factor RimP